MFNAMVCEEKSPNFVLFLTLHIMALCKEIMKEKLLRKL